MAYATMGEVAATDRGDAGRQPDAPAPDGRGHIAFLDGLRGFAALYVMFWHIFCLLTPPNQSAPTHPVVYRFLLWTIAGRSFVAVFIVLSGFVLSRQVFLDTEIRLRGGILDFIKRRARRILPPYYAALGLSFVFWMLFRHIASPTGWDFTDMFFHGTKRSFLAHLFLLHDVSSAWQYNFDIPLWSIAVEWQIYFVFALLMAPVLKKFGALAVVGMCLALSFFFFRVLPQFNETSPWYMADFSFGLLAARLAYGGRFPLKERFLRLTLVSIIAICGLYYLLHNVRPLLSHQFAYQDALRINSITTDMVVGLGIASLILYLTISAASGRPNRLVQILSSKASLAVGAFSYSLYLTHAIVLVLLDQCLVRWLGVMQRFCVLILIGVPACLLFAKIFYNLAERPTLAKR